MNRLPKQLDQLNAALQELNSNNGFAGCQRVVDSVVALLGIPSQDTWKLFTDSQGKIRSNATWFMLAEGFADKRAAYKIAEENDSNLDLKAYWMKGLSKSITSWLAALTPNFEDEPFYSKKNIGIDFIIPESADRIVVVLSNNYVVRTLELHTGLSVTQQEIFAKWLIDFDFENRAQVHKLLWDSFDLEPVNKAFYKGISSFFVELKQLLVANKVFDDKHAAYFTNRLIGRLVFCWFLDKKGIVNPEMKYFHTEKLKGTDYYHGKLETLFFRVFNTPVDERDSSDLDNQKHLFPEAKPKSLFNATIDFKTPFLNGGLFEIKENDLFGTPKLIFPDDYFDRFYDFLRHYNFTTDESTSSFQQVAIDPEMLGRIFENLLAEQAEETGEQARKAKGAFYTPREIVDYMCRESLREYLKSKIPESHDRDQRLSQLLDSRPHEWRDQQRNYRDKLKQYKAEIIDALDNVKIIDPACGSGAFPMGMLHWLLQCYERLEPRFDQYKSKLEIIKNNLFGVDIEPMAVEISRLRAWLSIIVDEGVDSSKIEPLPNLDFKFVCANSLIPLEQGQRTLGDDSKLEEQILEIRDNYYNAKKLSAKQSLREKYESLISKKRQTTLFRKSLRQAQLESYHPFDSELVTSFFDPSFMYGLKHFNIVIANPPYLKERDSAHIFRNVNESSFGKMWHQGKMDFWYYFLHKAIDITTDDGLISFITSRYWLNSRGATKLIKRISTELSFTNVVDIGSLKVFDNVVGQHMIAIYSRKANENFEYKTLFNDLSDLDKKVNSENITISIRRNAGVFPDTNQIEFDHDPISYRNSVPLETYFLVSQGVVQNPDKVSKKASSEHDLPVNAGVFVLTENELSQLNLNEEERTFVKPFYDEKDIGRYLIAADSHKYLLYITRQNCSDIEKYPNLMAHLVKYKSIMDGRRETIAGTIKWFQLHWPRDPIYFEGRKIVQPGMFARPRAAYSKSASYFGLSSNVIISNSKNNLSYEYLLGILNSKLAYFWYLKHGKKRGVGVDIGVESLRQFPIPESHSANKSLVAAIEKTVNQIRSEKKRQFDFDITALEEQLDGLVFELYELTTNEIECIRGAK